MSTVRAWFARLGGLFGKDRRDRELAAELESHVQMHIEDSLRSGMTPQEARRQALLRLGGVEQTKEKLRERRGIPRIETLLQNIRFGLRILHKNPGFTAIVVLTLALGVGANTAIFTVAYATLLAPLPYPNPERLVNVWSKLQGHRNWVSAGDFIEWKRQSTVFEDVNAATTDDFNIAGRDRPEFFDGMEATPSYYAMLGNHFFLGRNFLREEGESGQEHVVILTYRLWRHFGANPQIIGQTMQINGEPYRVVGVFEPGIADRWDWELIVPLVFKPEQQVDHDSRYLSVTGRLKPSITIKQALAEMESITAREAKDYPTSNQGWGASVEPLKNDFLSSDRRLTLWLLLGAVGFLLLIACLNVANLLLAKGIARQREIAIRCVLGAKPTAIFTQFLTESLVLAILGGGIGVAAGYGMLTGLIGVMPAGSLPAEADLRLNASILLVMLTATTLAGVLFGCAPAWYASRLDPAEVLKEGGRSGIGVGRQRFRRVLVIVEFGLALPLLAGAGLAIRSFWNLTHVDLGVRTDHVVGFYLEPVSALKTPKLINAYYRRILDNIEAVPGVSHACAMSYLPLDSLHAETPFSIAGKPAFANSALRPNADLAMVTPDYFQTFGIRIVEGRAFTDADNQSSFRVAMVNEVFVSRFLQGVNPLEQRVVMEQVIPGDPESGPAVEWQIVGVFHTVKSRGSREDTPEIDTPFWQQAFPISAIGVRTAGDPAAMIKSIAAAVNAADPEAALYKPRTMEQVHDEVLANDRFAVILFSSFAAVGLLLAAVGINGLTAFSVAQRSHEIALRMALGGTRNRVIALIVREGLILACVGLGLGLLGAYFVGRGMQAILFNVGVIDFSTLAAVGLALLLAAVFACYLPARKATRVNPMVALRYE
jgi:putative ABC transport system permease protein